MKDCENGCLIGDCKIRTQCNNAYNFDNPPCFNLAIKQSHSMIRFLEFCTFCKFFKIGSTMFHCQIGHDDTSGLSSKKCEESTCVLLGQSRTQDLS